MQTPTQAILWQIYWRARWGLAGAIAFLALGITLAQWLPRHWTIRIDDSDVPAVAWLFGVSGLWVNFVLMAAFGMSGSDARDLTFTRHLYVLPVSTRTLVAWPMVSGCLTVALFWLINAQFIFRASGIDAPLWFPAAGFALLLATFQALAWTPFAQRWLHINLTIVVLMSPLLAVPLVILWNIEFSQPVLTAVLVGLIPVAYLAAVSGVARARWGDPYDWRAWTRFVERLAKWRPAATHAFGSMHAAQLWYECRAHFVILIFVVCILPCFLFVPALEKGNVELGWRLLGGMLGAPLLVAMISGGVLGHLTDPASPAQAGTFVLVRPISSLSILRGKLVAAAIMTAVLWIVFLGFILLLLTRPGFAQSIAQVASSVSLGQTIGVPLVVLALLMLVTWKNMVEGLWITLTGRKWVEMCINFGFMGLVFLGGGIGLWIFFHPALHKPALDAVPLLMAIPLLIKLAVAVLVVRALMESRLTGRAGAALMIGVWLAIVAALSALALRLLPPEYASAKNIIPGLALFIPFSRLAGAPLALEWNRHR